MSHTHVLADGSGKVLAKWARLALIADELEAPNVRDDLVQRIIVNLNKWFDGQNGNELVYDTIWGGMVPMRGLLDPGADFGAGRYNDHHFHYGYMIYGAAVAAKFDRQWGVDRRQKLLALARDIANPSTGDGFFAQLRHFDMFDGHSWASGLFSFGDGG